MRRIQTFVEVYPGFTDNVDDFKSFIHHELARSLSAEIVKATHVPNKIKGDPLNPFARNDLYRMSLTIVDSKEWEENVKEFVNFIFSNFESEDTVRMILDKFEDLFKIKEGEPNVLL